MYRIDKTICKEKVNKFIAYYEPRTGSDTLIGTFTCQADADLAIQKHYEVTLVTITVAKYCLVENDTHDGINLISYR